MPAADLPKTPWSVCRNAGASLQCERPGQGNMCQHQRAPAMLASRAEDSRHVLHLQASFTGHRAYHSYHDSTPYVHGTRAWFESEAFIS